MRRTIISLLAVGCLAAAAPVSAKTPRRPLPGTYKTVVLGVTMSLVVEGHSRTVRLISYGRGCIDGQHKIQVTIPRLPIVFDSSRNRWGFGVANEHVTGRLFDASGAVTGTEPDTTTIIARFYGRSKVSGTFLVNSNSCSSGGNFGRGEFTATRRT
jgi:hypothetical protein